MNGDPRKRLDSITSPSSADAVRSRNRRKDDAIRTKVEAELSRRSATKRGERKATVSSLQPAQAHTISENARIIQACQLMAAKRTDAVLVMAGSKLVGILTDRDIAYRVVAESLDVRTTPVSFIMTKNPTTVLDRGNRNEALNIMISKQFRHLPVIRESTDEDSDETCVVGLLDITKCVFERLDDLERKVYDDQSIINAMEVLERRGTLDSERAGAVRDNHGCPDLSFVLEKTSLYRKTDHKVPSVSLKSSVREAARVMKAQRATAVLVLSDDEVAGIFTTKDIVLRVVAASLDPYITSVVRVMVLKYLTKTPHPDYASPTCTILEALRKLHAGNYLHLPVIDSGKPVGLVDVMQLTVTMLTYLMNKDGYNFSEAENETGPMWNKFWNSTFAGGSNVNDCELSEQDLISISSDVQLQNIPLNRHLPSRLQTSSSHLKRSIADEASSLHSEDISSQFRFTNDMPLESLVDNKTFSFKLKVVGSTKTYRFKSECDSLSKLYEQITSKTGYTSKLLLKEPGMTDYESSELSLNGAVSRLCYLDDEMDTITLVSDQDVEEAVFMAIKSGQKSLTIYLGEPSIEICATSTRSTSPILQFENVKFLEGRWGLVLGVSQVAVGICLILAFVLYRRH